jgi:hypothetical protein
MSVAGWLLEFEQQVAEKGEAFRAEPLRPCSFHLGDGVADHANRGDTAPSEDNAFGTEVVGVWFEFEVTESLEFAEQVVERLLADPDLGCDVDLRARRHPHVDGRRHRD